MYYPKSQITENLHSNGDFFIKKTRERYIGLYFKISTGQCFSGEPNIGTNEEITNNTTSKPNVSSINNYNYNILKNNG